MRLATIDNQTRDGQLVVVDKAHKTYCSAVDIAPTLQFALDHWDVCAEKLAGLYDSLNAGRIENATPIDWAKFLAPLPRAYEWVDGSAYINHVVLVRKARGAEPPETLETDPLVYQGGSGVMLAPHSPIYLANPDWGLDFESEVVVYLSDTPQGISAGEAGHCIRLVGICNDISLRNLIPNELKKGFGFFNSKPASAFAPIVVTPDELGEAWRDGRLHLPMQTRLNGELFGNPDAGPEMHFSFCDLIAHIAKTRSFTAGTIVGSGTVSNQDRSKGSSCLAERRMIEIIDDGSAKTSFMKAGDHVEIEVLDEDGFSVFGKIDQRVVSERS